MNYNVSRTVRSVLFCLPVLIYIFISGCAAFKKADVGAESISALAEAESISAPVAEETLPAEQLVAAQKIETGELEAAETVPSEQDVAPETLNPRAGTEEQKPTPEYQKKKETSLERALRTVKIGSLCFHEEKLSNVLKVITSMTGVNFMVKKKYDIIDSSQSKSEDEEIENKILETEVSIAMKNIRLGTAIQVLCNQYGLMYKAEGEFVRIMKKREVFMFDYLGGVAQADGTETPGIIKRLELKGMYLEDVLNKLSKKTGLNIVCRTDPGKGEKNIALIPVWLLVKDVSVVTAVEVICKKYNLWYRQDKDKNYICLMRAEDFGDEMDLDYSIRTRIYNLKYASAPELADTIASVMGDRVDYALPSNLESYVNLKHLDVEDDDPDVEQAKSESEVTDVIEIPDFKKNLEENLTPDKIEELLKKSLGLKLTARDLRWINKELGFAILSIFLRNNAIIATSTDEGILDEIGSIIARLDTPTPQVLIECRILDVTLSDDFTSFFDITNFEYREKGGDSYGNTEKFWTRPAGNFMGGSGMNVLYNYVSDRLKFDATLEILKKDGIVNIVATPMILTAQHSQAKIESGMENFPFFKEMDVVRPEVTDNQILPGYAIPTYDRVPLVGTTLQITPQVNEDKSVVLDIIIEQSSVKKGVAEIKYPVFTSTGTVQGLESSMVDVKDTEKIQSVVMIPAGATLALGGLVEEEDSSVESKVPFFGDLPLIGFFFRDQEIVKHRTEKVFLLTPHIIMAPEQVGEITDKVLKDYSHPVIKNQKKDLFKLDEEGQRLERNTN
ncbi:MAG: hypothetical protein JJV89_02100 [Desulfosarcina sp.]|nr:hypothetical protein [Desulfobacterales bacterium]